MNPTFWTVFKADLLFSLCSITVGMAVTIVLAIWRKKRLAKKMAEMKGERIEGPRAVIVGGKDLHPGHCPLCGRDWPLPGPVGPPKEI